MIIMGILSEIDITFPTDNLYSLNVINESEMDFDDIVSSVLAIGTI